MTGARSVKSNQDSIHKDLEELVRKYARTSFLRPIADHTREAFAKAEKFIESFYESKDQSSECKDRRTPVQVILDSGCGTGESTIHIAKRFPDIPVIGIDKSLARLDKAENAGRNLELPSNAFWVRGELLDFWKLAHEKMQEGLWTVPYHAIFFPNPWPKQSEATRRFHMHPIFPTMLPMAKVTELRTNWEIYAQEFAKAATILGSEKNIELCAEYKEYRPEEPETAFERKYMEARQQLWQVIVTCGRPSNSSKT